MLPPLRRCWDMTHAHVEAALVSKRAMGTLLRMMASLAEPKAGAAKILIAIAAMGRAGCDWFEGTMRVEIEGDESETRISVMSDLGAVRELAFPRLVLAVPLEELARGLRIAPRAVEPLGVRESGGRWILTPRRRKMSLEMPSFQIAEDSLKKSLPPKVRKTLAPPPAKKKSEAPPPKKKSEAPPSRRSGAPRRRASSAELILSIPRAPKFLDFGDLEPSPPATAPKTGKAKPPPLPRPGPNKPKTS